MIPGDELTNLGLVNSKATGKGGSSALPPFVIAIGIEPAGINLLVPVEP